MARPDAAEPVPPWKRPFMARPDALELALRR
jgi:hypothetical protein